MSATHKNIKTPDPRYRSLLVNVDEDSFATAGGVLPAQGTLYSDPAWRTFLGSDYRKNYKDFVYVQQLEDTKTGGTLVFARNLTDEQRNTPFRSLSSFGNHRWPPILKHLSFVPVRDFPLTTQGINQAGQTGTFYAVRYLTREVYIPETNEGSRFVTDEFISPTPFKIPQYPVPTTTSISYHYLNLNGGFPDCLHKKFDLAALISTSSGSFGGTVSSNYNEIQGQVFPATNFTEWAPYVISDTQELVGGVYYRKRIRVYPPPEPNVIIKTY